MGNLIALTGATGFIGTRLCTQLRDQHYAVRALARNPARAAALSAAGVDIIPGDLSDPAALASLVDGCDAVIHAAGAVRGNDQAQFMHTNRDGTARLVEAVSGRAPSAHFLLISSIAAREPLLSWYGRSKREGEERLMDSELDWTILRPPAVYGPGDEEMKTIFDWMARGIALVPGSTAARNSLIHVDDLVEGILACLTSPAARGQRLQLCDGKAGGYDWQELADVAGTVYRRRVRLWHPPTLLLDAIARINLWLGRLSDRPAMLTPPKLRELRHDNWVVDNEAISAATGWAPRISLGEGLGQLSKSAL